MSSPYQLPDGPVAIQFSGGRTSGYMLHQILQHYDGQLPQDCHVLFQNTGREMPETLDFVQRCSEEWGQRIVWLEYDPDTVFREVNHNSAGRNGEPFERLIRKKQALPNRRFRWCTQFLKVVPSEVWMEVHGYSPYFAAVGIRADERHRVKENRDDKHTLIYPLADAGVGKHEIVAFWRQQSFSLALPTDAKGSTPLSNCDGCMLKSEKIRAHLAKYRPDRAQWWANMENQVGAIFGNPQRGERGWAALIDHAQRQQDWVFNEEVDLYCDVGFGGCHD